MAPKTARDPVPTPPCKDPAPEAGGYLRLEQESRVIEGALLPTLGARRRRAVPSRSPRAEQSPHAVHFRGRSPGADPSISVGESLAPGVVSLHGSSPWRRAVPARIRPFRGRSLVQSGPGADPSPHADVTEPLSRRRDWVLAALGSLWSPPAGLPCLGTQLGARVCVLRVQWGSPSGSLLRCSQHLTGSQKQLRCAACPRGRGAQPQARVATCGPPQLGCETDLSEPPGAFQETAALCRRIGAGWSLGGL